MNGGLTLRSKRSERLEGWERAPCLLPTLRDGPPMNDEGGLLRMRRGTP